MICGGRFGKTVENELNPFEFYRAVCFYFPLNTDRRQRKAQICLVFVYIEEFLKLFFRGFSRPLVVESGEWLSRGRNR